MKNRQLKKLCKKSAALLEHEYFGSQIAALDYYGGDEDLKVHGYWDCSYEYPNECDFIDAWHVLQQHFDWAFMEVDPVTLHCAYRGPKWTARNVLRWAMAQAT